MKYLVICTLFVNVFALNIFGGENSNVNANERIILLRNLTPGQLEEVEETREKFLEEFRNLENRLTFIRTETQMEMIKENPDWSQIRRLNRESAKLQKTLKKEIDEYKYKMETIHLDVEDIHKK